MIQIYITVTKVNIYVQIMAHLHGGATMWINVCTPRLYHILLGLLHCVCEFSSIAMDHTPLHSLPSRDAIFCTSAHKLTNTMYTHKNNHTKKTTKRWVYNLHTSLEAQLPLKMCLKKSLTWQFAWHFCKICSAYPWKEGRDTGKDGAMWHALWRNG